MNKLKLTDVSETMLIPLYCRASETKRQDGLIKDPKAIDMVSQINYDFSKFEKSEMSQLGVACRTVILDEQTKKFITEHPDGVCVSVGCGLDTRFSRVDNGQIKWYDLDLNEVINIRKNFFKNTDREKMINKSIFDETWTDEIECEGKKVLFIFEGILMYFKEEEIKQILNIINKNFKNPLILMELSSKLMIKFGSLHETLKKTEANFKWGVKKAEDLEKLSDNIIFQKQWYLFDILKNKNRLSKKQKTLLSIISPIFNQFNNKIALYKLQKY